MPYPATATLIFAIIFYLKSEKVGYIVANKIIFSIFVQDVQAVTNVLLGERYKQISKEVKNYFKGEYGIAPAPVSKELEEKILGEGGKPVDCRIEDAKRTGEDFKAAKEALGDLARSEEDVMSYICFPDQAKKYLEKRKSDSEKTFIYSIEEA